MTTAAASGSFYFLLGGSCPLGRAPVGQGSCGPGVWAASSKKASLSYLLPTRSKCPKLWGHRPCCGLLLEVSVVIRTPEEHDAVLSYLEPDKKLGKLLLAGQEGAR